MAAYMFLDINGSAQIADEVSATALTLSLAASEIDENDYGIWLPDNLENLRALDVCELQSVNYVSGIRCKPCDRYTP
jgi:prophage maintenance system killer protein